MIIDMNSKLSFSFEGNPLFQSIYSNSNSNTHRKVPETTFKAVFPKACRTKTDESQQLQSTVVQTSS